MSSVKEATMPLKRVIYSVLLKVLRPVVRIAMREGVSSQEFHSLLKQAYVDVAQDDFRIPGKKQSVSRLAVLTGMTRTEIANLLAKSAEGSKMEKYQKFAVSALLASLKMEGICASEET